MKKNEPVTRLDEVFVVDVFITNADGHEYHKTRKVYQKASYARQYRTRRLKIFDIMMERRKQRPDLWPAPSWTTESIRVDAYALTSPIHKNIV